MRFDREMQEQVARLFAPNAKPDSPGFAVGIVNDNQVVFREGFGQATLEWPSPITSETVFASSPITFLRQNGRVEAFVFRDYDGDGREELRFEKMDR